MKLFERIKPEMLSNVEVLSKRHNISLFEKIKAEENLVNFKSLLTEAHFGIYFDQIGQQIRYNQKIGTNDLTPDFLFKLNGQDIIAEVCHINPAQKDMDIQSAEDIEYETFKSALP